MSSLVDFVIMPKDLLDDFLDAYVPQSIVTQERYLFFFSRQTSKLVSCEKAFLEKNGTPGIAFPYSGALLNEIEFILEDRGLQLSEVGIQDDRLSEKPGLHIQLFDMGTSQTISRRLDNPPLTREDVSRHLTSQDINPEGEIYDMTTSVLNGAEIFKSWLNSVGADHIGVLRYYF